MKITVTKKSGNRKTGPIPVTITGRESCPKSCAFYGAGCYAESWPLKLHWDKVNKPMGELFPFIRSLPAGQVWRHNQAGDLPGINGNIHKRLFRRIVLSNRGRRGFTYTHKPVLTDSPQSLKNRELIAWSNREGFTVNLSGNNLDHADQLARLQIAPVVTVLPSDHAGKQFATPAGNPGIVCPAQYRDTTCADCKLCANPGRQYMIGFLAHGTHTKKANIVARG